MPLQYMVAPTELVPTNLPPIPEPAKSEQGLAQLSLLIWTRAGSWGRGI